MSKTLHFDVLDFQDPWFIVRSFDEYFWGTYPAAIDSKWVSTGPVYKVRKDDLLVTNPETKKPFIPWLLKLEFAEDLEDIINE